MRGGRCAPCRDTCLTVKVTLLCFRSLHSHAQNYASRSFALTAQFFTLLGRYAFLVALSLRSVFKGSHRSSFAPMANANRVCTPSQGLGKGGLTR